MLFGRQSDIALEADPARRYLPWLIAMIVYLAGLALAGMMSLASAVDRWDKGLSGTVTVQVPPPPAAASGTAAARVEKALAVLRGTPGVASARALTADETAALLEPWLGRSALAHDLPLPSLIDVRIRTEAPPDMAGLASVLDEAVPGTVVDDHKKALDRLIALARSVELVALAVVALVALAAVATVVFITRTGLAIHAGAIELLHLIGAVDSYVARQFQGQALELGVKGGAIGLALTAATVLVLGRFTGAVAGGLLPDLSLSAGQWAALAAVPAAITVIGMATAHVTVMRALKRLP